MRKGVTAMSIGVHKGENARLVAAVVTLFAALLAAGILALVVARSAEAAFPGTNNGEIIFWSNRSASPGLYKITVGGTATKIPGTSNGDNHPVWSPDGSRIAFTSASRSNYEVSVMNADGSGRRQLTSTTVAEEEPAWSPDGTRIAFVRGGEIYMINADGSGETNLTNNPADDSEPAWSPDGTQIAFVSGRNEDSNRNIYVMSSDGSGTAVSLTANSTNPVYQGHDDHPSWSPDGTQITYSNNGDGDADVYKMDTDPATKDWTNLTDGNLGVDVTPAWSPDGTSIAYVAASGSTDRNIYVMNANVAGSGSAIDTTVAHDIAPDWQPNPPTCDITGTSGNDNPTTNPAFVGTTADETICGLGGNDVIDGGGGNDILLGGDGADTLVVPSGRATLNGGAGNDVASFAGSATSIEASLLTAFAQRVGTTPLEGAALVGIESLTGSGLDDDLTGSNAANKLVGGAGADTLLGLGGKDTLNSKDNINRNDTVNGGAGSDKCVTDTKEASITSC